VKRPLTSESPTFILNRNDLVYGEFEDLKSDLNEFALSETVSQVSMAGTAVDETGSLSEISYLLSQTLPSLPGRPARFSTASSEFSYGQVSFIVYVGRMVTVLA
jgi:hypothetical protein